MPLTPNLRRPLPLAAFLIVLLIASDAFAVQLVSRVATARIRSGNTTLTSDTVSGFAPGPIGSTGLVEANGANILPDTPPIDAGAVTEHDLPIGAIGSSAGFDATANGPGDLRVFDPHGGGSATWLDDLTVTSSTLPNGTPVTIRFTFDLAFTADTTSTLSLATAAADCSSTANGVQGLTSSTNRYFSSLEHALFIEDGLFLPPYQAEYTISTTVGSTFSFATACDVSSHGTVFVTGPPGNQVNHESSGWMAIGVAIGGEVVGADAQITSGLIGGPFPGVPLDGPAAALIAIPANPYELPEPAFGMGLVLGGLLCAALHRRRRLRGAVSEPRSLS